MGEVGALFRAQPTARPGHPASDTTPIQHVQWGVTMNGPNDEILATSRAPTPASPHLPLADASWPSSDSKTGGGARERQIGRQIFCAGAARSDRDDELLVAPAASTHSPRWSRRLRSFAHALALCFSRSASTCSATTPGTIRSPVSTTAQLRFACSTWPSAGNVRVAVHPGHPRPRRPQAGHGHEGHPAGDCGAARGSASGSARC